MADEKVEFGVADGRRRPEVRVPVLLPLGYPAICAPHQIGTDDHAVPVVFESLRGVDAADLPEALGLGCPECGGWGARQPPIALEIPWPRPGSDLDVAHQVAVTLGITPWPTKPRSHTSAIARITVGGEARLQLGRSLDHVERKSLVSLPGRWATIGEPQQPLNPDGLLAGSGGFGRVPAWGSGCRPARVVTFRS